MYKHGEQQRVSRLPEGHKRKAELLVQRMAAEQQAARSAQQPAAPRALRDKRAAQQQSAAEPQAASRAGRLAEQQALAATGLQPQQQAAQQQAAKAEAWQQVLREQNAELLRTPPKQAPGASHHSLQLCQATAPCMSCLRPSWR